MIPDLKVSTAAACIQGRGSCSSTQKVKLGVTLLQSRIPVLISEVNGKSMSRTCHASLAWNSKQQYNLI